jgi:serine/threonine-protein kinase
MPGWGNAAALLLTLALLAPRGWAQSTSDKVAAEGLFDQGRSAMQRGDFVQACGLLERSQRIDPAVGTLLYLAECYEKAGRTASAWATFREAADAAEAAREPMRARTGRERATRLEPVLARLTIQLGPDNERIQGLSVERGGQTMQAATWNVPVPIDPGDQLIAVSAPGYEAWSTTVTVPARAASLSVTVPPLKKNPEAEKAAAPAEGAPPAAPASPDNARTDASPTPPPVSEQNGDTQRIAAYVVGGAGIVGIGVGSFFGLRAISKSNDANKQCPRGFQCDTLLGATLTDDAKSAATISNVAFSVGAAALVGGVVLYLTAPSKPAPATAMVRAHLRPTGVTLEGTF